MIETVARPQSAFLPSLAAADPGANAWLRQATLRLRREVTWRWRQRGNEPLDAALPPAEANPLIASLDLARHWEAQQAFYQSDATGRYLSDLIAQRPVLAASPRQGSFSWVWAELGLDDVAAFALALGLLARYDAAAGPVFAACLDAAGSKEPTLALVQRLWDEPAAALALADPTHPLWTHGLLQGPLAATGPVDWEAGFGVPPLVAARLLFETAPPSHLLQPITPAAAVPSEAELLVDQLRLQVTGLRIVPVYAQPETPAAAPVAAVAAAGGRRLLRIVAGPEVTTSASALRPLLTLAWLDGADLFLRDDSATSAAGDRQPSLTGLTEHAALPLTLFLQAPTATLDALPRQLLLPALRLAPLSYGERVDRWRRGLGADGDLDGVIGECARRFRFEAETIDAVCAGLVARPDRPRAEDLFAACRAAVRLDVGGLAQPVTPRFGVDELILPPIQRRQFEEIARAMRALTEVHYAWGTARAWNESGISVLFVGPSGTGKTMAAEVLAALLDIPMFRVNLSQVVNKYIGETEKNLERVFDAADAVETLLFFDEADALFGRRTEVKDAHDRYANLEVSYLLDRMERFKGLAILATNRRGDLDEAFLRRLRYVVEFPVPDVAERRQIWQRVIPAAVDASDLDFDFLARRFQLTGGNIRSAVFNACLQTAEGHAGNGSRPRLTMECVVVAVKREYDKLQRTVSLTQFGPYAKVVEEETVA